MGKKVERGKAAAAPAQKHNIMNFFDPAKAAGKGPPQAQIQQPAFNPNPVYVQNQIQQQQQQPAQRPNNFASGPAAPAVAGPSRPQPAPVNKHLAKAAEIDLIDNNISSQIEWEEDFREDNIRAFPGNVGGNGAGNLGQPGGHLQRTAVNTSNKQRLLQGSRQLVASGSPGDEVLEEVLAGLCEPAAAGGAVYGVLGAGQRRRVSNGSPASDINNHSAGGNAPPYRTPGTGHRRPGIIRNNGLPLGRLNRPQGRKTPTSVAFKAGPGGISGLNNGGINKPRFGPINAAATAANGGLNGVTTTGKKRRQAQFCQALDNMLYALDTDVADGDDDGGDAVCNDVVGPSSRLAAVVATKTTAAAAVIGGSPPPAAPPSQRPRYDTTTTTDGQHVLPDGVVNEMNRLFENWQSPSKQQKQQQEVEEAAAAAAAAVPAAAVPPPPPLAEVMLASTQPQPAAMEAPPPSPYIHLALPSQSKDAAQVNLEAIQKNHVVGIVDKAAKALWGDDSDEDFDDIAVLEAAAASKKAATTLQHPQPHAAQQLLPAAAPPAPAPAPTSNINNVVITSAATQHPSSTATTPILAGDRALVHYTVVAVWPDCPSIDGAFETQLQVHNPYSGLQVIVHVQEPYNQDTVYLPNDPINLMVPKLDDFNGQYHCIVGGKRGDPRAMIVHFPDILLGGTRVAGSTQCPRQGFLQERIAGGDGTNEACTKGNMYHALFQTALAKGLRTSKTLESHAEVIASSSPAALLDSNMTEHQALSYLKASIPKMIGMLNRFQRQTPLDNAILSGGYDPSTGNEIKRAAAIPEVLDIEEYIAAPKFGLKGFIDASIKLSLKPISHNNKNAAAAVTAGGGAGEIVVAPLELKTGQPRDSDKAQVLLYLLAMEERYGKPLNWGLLVNSNPRTTEPQRLIAREDQQLASLMAARNRLAASLSRGSLPGLTYLKSNCNRCFARTECMLSHSAIEFPDAVAAPAVAAVGAPDAKNSSFVDGMMPGGDRDTLEAIYQSETAHLSSTDKDFLRHWASLLDLEATGATKQRPEIWAMTGQAREAAGRCVSGLTIIRAVKKEGSDHVFYVFARRGGGVVPTPFSPGEMLMLGVDGRHAGVGRGHLYESTAETLTVIMEKELREGLLFPRGKLAVPQQQQVNNVCCDPSVVWRLDKEEVGTTTPRIRGFLYSLFARSFEKNGTEDLMSARAGRLRKFIVDLAAPAATTVTAEDQNLINAVDKEAKLLNLNKEQHHAVRCAVLSKDYSLVLGMPGAGKTTAIVAMLRSLATVGKRVLLTSYTNSAVDNVLLKLAQMAGKEEFIPFVRVGRESRVNPKLVDYTPSGSCHKANTAGELACLVDTVKIWGVSALGTTDALIRRREFDVVIVDEAGQITLPATLGPLLRGDTFVLVGDPHQLPPLVTSEEAADKGLAEPLFARLAAAHPSAVVTLPVQYRMAEEIQVLPNLLSYNGEMKCASEAIAGQMLHFPLWETLLGSNATTTTSSYLSLPWTSSGNIKLTPTASWLVQVLDPRRRVVFLDTSSMPAPEVKVGEAVTNPSEADITLSLVSAAVRAGLPASAIGLISPYNRQVSLLDKLTRSAGLGATECLTIDKAQGRDKECILVSLVKSNVEKETGKLLTDIRRVNVAITRAKAKLILIGDASTLKALPLFAKVLNECEKRDWVVSVPTGALEK